MQCGEVNAESHLTPLPKHKGMTMPLSLPAFKLGISPFVATYSRRPPVMNTKVGRVAAGVQWAPESLCAKVLCLRFG